MRRLLIAALTLWLFAPAANATPVIADLSTYRISMDAYFTGTRLFLFGARNDSGDIVVVVRGPARDYIMRKKERYGGIWINSSRMKFFNIPAFYSVAASRKLEDMGHADLFRKLGVGQNNLLLPSPDPRTLAGFQQYSDAFLDLKKRQRRYALETGSLDFMGETLFKTVIEFPDNIPPGHYTAEIYLVGSGQVIGMQTLPLTVVKTGLEAWLYDMAHERPLLYGIMAVLLALSIGWLASRIFEKI